MSFSDIIKKSVLEGFNSGDLTTARIAITLGMAVLLGLFIYFIYRFTIKNGFYNKSFNKALAVLPVITAGIILAMQSNLIISLGMVGALSIIRFRNAVKDSSDLMFLFWSISAGIIVGANLFKLAILASLFITALMLILDLLPVLRQPCLLVISSNDVAHEPALMSCIRKQCPKAKVRSRNITKHGVEWIFELRANDEAELVNSVTSVKGVISVNLLTHDGDVRF